MHGREGRATVVKRNTSSLLWGSLAVCCALPLAACGRHAHEGKPVPGPNVAIAQSYIDAISHPGEPIRAVGCRIGSPMPLLFYVILFPGTAKNGVLLIYSPPYNWVPRVQAATFNAEAHAWQLQELPHTDWSFRHLTALKLTKYGSDNRAIGAEFNRIMANQPAFTELVHVDVAPLIYSPAARQWLTTLCP